MKTITINDIRAWNPCYDPSKLIESLKDLILCAYAESWISDTVIMKKIEVGKFYKTTSGREVRIYAVDGGSKRPVHGAYLESGKKWVIASWALDGAFYEGIDPMDIVIPPLRYEGIVRFHESEFLTRSNAMIHVPPGFAGKQVKYSLEEI